MTRVFSVLFALLFLSFGAVAQKTAAGKPLKKVITLEMPGDGGSNGASIAWHPVQKKYYTSMAGNAIFNFGIFDATGKRLSPEDQEALADLRGIWYEPVSKSIQANTYDEGGWVQYKLNNKGQLTVLTGEDDGADEARTQLQEGMTQPDAQSVGFYDAKTKRICFLSGMNIVQYSMKGEALDDVIELKIEGADEMDEEANPMENYNSTTVCYTGLPNAEFGLHNTLNNEIELYNRKGQKTKSLKLPEGAPSNSMFNFGYANGTWWLFDKDARKWFGYK